MPGEWDEQDGIGYGPFGFGSSVKMGEKTCMADSDYVLPGDECQINPKFCKNGLSFSIWEKMIYPEDAIKDYFKPQDQVPKKYILSNGGQYDRDTGKAWPGVAIYHQGVDLVAMVTTGEEVWEIRVAGQMYNNTWTNIGVRWVKPDFTDTSVPFSEAGGLELFVNLERVGHSVMPETTKDGAPVFEEMKLFEIGGYTPPVLMVGCHFDQVTGQYDHFSEAEYDEIAMWSRKLGTNATHDETVFFFGGFESKFEDVNPEQFKALLNNADLGDDVEAEIANDILEAMLLTPPPTPPAIPTPTAGVTEAVTGNGNGQGTTPATTQPIENPDAPVDASSLEKLAKEQLTIQGVMSTMLNADNVPPVRNPEQVEIRLPVSVVAAKILSGRDSKNVDKWSAVYDLHKHEEGAPKTVRELEDYMLAWVGATNTSYTKRTSFFDPKTQSMKYPVSGEDFVMNVEKMQPSEFRKSARLQYPNYNGLEWSANKDKWGQPQDTFSIPTGLFKDQPGCNENPVTFMASIYNKLDQSMPARRNAAIVRSNVWTVDSRIISTGASANINPLSKDQSDVNTVAQCRPNVEYLKENPVRAVLYHKEPGRARLTRRLLSFFTDNDYNVGGIEVRHCVRWNYDFGSNGAWDPTGCTLVETDAEKTKCECSHLGMMTVVMERSEPIEANDDCLIPNIIKYIGIVVSVLLLLTFIFVTIGSKYVWDMFHVIRIHLAICWIGAILFHVATDIESVRDDAEINLIIGFFMKYFYTAAVLWTAMDAHSHFKAFTSGIISGRVKVYIPFGYGAPFIPLGILFLVYHDDLGIDPRCFVAWNRDAKILYLLTNLAISIAGVVFAIIIVFNINRPQTKRRNLVDDLTAQAYGTVALCFFTMILWIFATITYLHKEDSDMPDPYCIFVIFLGWFGAFMFGFIGAMSKKFRHGLKSEKRLKNELMPAYLATKDLENESMPDENNDNDDSPFNENQDDSASITSRATTATSVAQLNQEANEDEEAGVDDDEQGNDDSSEDEEINNEV